MEKPITVKRHDFIQSIVDLINNSGLPAFMVMEILKACINEMEPMVNSQYEKDLKAYQQSLEEVNNDVVE